MKFITNDLGIFWEAIRLIFKCDRRLFFVRLLLITLKSFMPLVSLYVLKLLIDEVSSSVLQHDRFQQSTVWLFAGVYCGVFLFTRIIDLIDQFSVEILSVKLTDFISDLLHKKSTELDLAYYDDSKYHDTFHQAQQEASHRPNKIMNDLVGLASNGFTLIGVAVLLSAISWIGIVIVFVANLPSLCIKIIKSRSLFHWRKENTPLFRKSNYFSMLMTNRTYAKEIRVFRLASHFQEQFTAIRAKLMQQILTILVKLVKFDFFSLIFEGGTMLFFIYLLSNKVISGTISIGGFVMCFQAFSKGQGYIQNLISSLSGLYENKLFLKNLFDFLLLQPTIKSPARPVTFPKKIINGIRFHNVTFAYPDSNKTVIKNFNLTAKPGEITRIQGANGWGKTTLIKLLFRLYECTDGTISIDNVDIKNFDILELRKNLSVVFQDFVQFDLTVRDNIVLADLNRGDYKKQMEQAVNLSCAKPVIEQLSSNYDTLLGKYFEKGVELSMGQWQRIALGRALFADTPIVVLDEPTSWQDHTTEINIFNNLQYIKHNKIIILISHSMKNIEENIKTDPARCSTHSPEEKSFATAEYTVQETDSRQ